MQFSWKSHIGTRVVLSFAVILVLMTFASLLAIWCLYSVDSLAKSLANDKLGRQRSVIEWQSAVALNATRTMAIAKSDSLELADYFAKQLAEGDASIREYARHADKINTDEKEKQLLQAVGNASRAYLSVRDDIFKLKATGRTQDVERLISSRLEQLQSAYQGTLAQLVSHHARGAEVIAAESDRMFRTSVALIVGSGGLAVVIGFAFAIFLTRNIVHPVEHAANLARRVADGDLTSGVETSRRDEIGVLLHALSDMNEKLRHIVAEVRCGTQQIASASLGIVTGNADLSARAGRQASLLERTASSMDSITLSVQTNALHAQKASQLAIATSQLAQQGGSVVADAVDTMESINDSARKIVDIIAVIDGIAFQTNILALNAAVEAARAGAQGRGFAVVATEVRTLAQRSASAAKEIKALISDSVEKMEEGSDLVHRAGDTMEKVVQSVKQVTDMITAIAASSTEQRTGIEEVGHAITQIENVNQLNVAQVEESGAATQAMQDEANRLAQLMSVFKVEHLRM